jgi:DNA-nicking Smr family endonuclease
LSKVNVSHEKKDQSEKPSGEPGNDSPFDQPVVVPIEDSIDLHAFSPKDIPDVVGEYLEQCRRAGIYEVRVIHGRGKGVQRKIVRSILEKHPWVLSVKDAPAESGGWGSTIVMLRKY